MPLLKNGTPPAPVVPAGVEVKTLTVETAKSARVVTKDDYWRNREDRDIEKDKHIRLSGVLQALLISVNFGQYCPGTTKEEYLSAVEESALRLAKFVTDRAQ